MHTYRITKKLMFEWVSVGLTFEHDFVTFECLFCNGFKVTKLLTFECSKPRTSLNHHK